MEEHWGIWPSDDDFASTALHFDILVGGLEHFLFFHNMWDNPSHWLLYFSEGMKPPTSLHFDIVWLSFIQKWRFNHLTWNDGPGFWRCKKEISGATETREITMMDAMDAYKIIHIMYMCLFQNIYNFTHTHIYIYMYMYIYIYFVWLDWYVY